MSSNTVKQFIKEKELQKRNEVLDYYGLGEQVFFQSGDNINDYPLVIKKVNSYGNKVEQRYRIDCDITDEDFERILEIYNQEKSSSKVVETKDRPEKILSVFALILLIIGIIAFLALTITALQEGEGLLFVYGLGALLVALHGYAFNKVFVNISRKLNKLK